MNKRKFSKDLFVQILLSVPLSSEIRVFLSSRFKEAPLPVRVSRPVSGEKDEKVKVTFLLLLFSQIPSAQNIQDAKGPYFGVACPELHHIHSSAEQSSTV